LGGVAAVEVLPLNRDLAVFGRPGDLFDRCRRGLEQRRRPPVLRVDLVADLRIRRCGVVVGRCRIVQPTDDPEVTDELREAGLLDRLSERVG